MCVCECGGGEGAGFALVCLTVSLYRGGGGGGGDWWGSWLYVCEGSGRTVGVFMCRRAGMRVYFLLSKIAQKRKKESKIFNVYIEKGGGGGERRRKKKTNHNLFYSLDMKNTHKTNKIK